MTQAQVTPQSKAAHRHMQDTGKLGDEQAFVYQKLQEYGPATAMELHEMLVIVEDDHKSKILGPERVRKRLPELADMGLVMQLETRECAVTGRQANEYIAVDT